MSHLAGYGRNEQDARLALGMPRLNDVVIGTNPLIEGAITET